MRRQVHDLDRVALGEATRLFATSRNVAGRLERSTGLVAEVLPHPPQSLAYRDDGPGDFVLSVGRLDRAKRIDLLVEAAALEPSLQVVVTGDGPDRGAAGGARRSPRAAGPGQVRRTGVGRGARGSLCDCSSTFYAPVDEDFGMGPYESFLSGKPVITATDAGGPLEVVHDGSTGRVVAPEPAEIAAAAVWLREHPDEAAALGRAAMPWRPRSRGIARSGGCCREGRRLRPDATREIGNRRLLGPPAAGAPGPMRDRDGAAGAKKAPRGRISPSFTSGTIPMPTVGSSMRCAGTPGLVVLHDFVLHHLVSGITLGRGNGKAYLDALERDRGLPARLLGHAVMEKRIPPLWENRPEDFPLAGEVLDLATGLIVHSRHVHDCARGPASEGRSGSSRIPRSPCRTLPAIGSPESRSSPASAT